MNAPSFSIRMKYIPSLNEAVQIVKSLWKIYLRLHYTVC